ncbi:cytochrome P450 [Sphaerisporangium fuscum]|uniref:cytochrome P450 n=1 Tax=Sphaerisporangium fuscum TaxID=2835868 RepID=UPI001BDD4BEE|nr:cytochrome P450 [Sphaerisporangium fuscum]
MTAEAIPEFPFKSDKPLEPPAEWAEHRGRCPVTHVRLPSGDVAGLVSGYDDVRTVLSDQRFSRRLDREGAARMATTEDGGLFNRPQMAGVDISEGDGHRRWRRLLSRSFTVKKMEAWRPTIQRIADDLIDGMVAKGSPADIVADLGLPLPVRVICALVGAPAEDQDRFAHWSQVSLTLTRYTQQDVDRAQAEFYQYVSDLVERKRANPGDDLLSELTTISDAEDGRLSHEELIATVRGLLVAGHETTSNMIGKMSAMLLADRRHFEAVVDDPDLVRGTVEEVLRMDTNLGFGLPRYISEDIELSGMTVPAGTTLIVNSGAANRDERKFADPDRFDPRREPNQHITFGAGPHFCLGQTLARVELQVTLATLARRLPALRLRDHPDDLRLRTGLVTGGFQDLGVTW